MAENKMNEVAKLLGVELEEEFRLEDLFSKYKLTENGLKYWSDDLQQWYISRWLEELLTGEKKIIKLPKPILDDIEKEYLGNIIKPFRNKVKWIRKISSPTENFEYIRISYQDHNYSNVLNFPDFKVDTKYRGMKLDKLYTLKELGL